MTTRTPLPYHSRAVAAGRADDQRPVSRRRFATFLPALLVAGFVAGVSPAALGVPPGPPSEDHVWGGCLLTTGATGAVEALGKSLKGPGGKGVPSPQIDFVLVYTLRNDNDGQRFGDGTTGPILCTNPDTVSIETTLENTAIPASGNVDIKALEQALIMQYQQAGGIRNKRICHTVADNTDCFLIKPVPTPVSDKRKNGRRPRVGEDSDE